MVTEILDSKTIDKLPYSSGIYKIRNRVNEKVYIGSAFNLHRRIYLHCYLLRKNEHHNKHLQNAWNKYGEENFEFSVVELCIKDNLLIKEQAWLDYYKAYDNKFGYNICQVAGNTAGREFSEETKQKMRIASLGRKIPLEVRRRMGLTRAGRGNGMYGKHHTEESKQKIRENRKNMDGENNPFYGKHHTEETKQKLREQANNRKCYTHTKLSEKDVFNIKWKLFRKPKEMQWKTLEVTLGDEYNVSHKTIQNIRNGYRWESLIVKTYVDLKNRFVEMFNPNNGFYIRSGVIDENGKDTGIDPFMRQFPSLIDVGVMGWCCHGASGLCMKSGVQCYQNGLHTKEPNMSLENFKRIVDECKGKTFQFALGGRGDVDQHENFEEILRYCRENGIVPNFTSSGLGFTEEIVELCKELCGAVAISWYRQNHTYRAIQMLLDAGVKTNIHYVLGNNSIDEAIERLKNNDFPKGINAVVFLLHKNVGLGQDDNVLQMSDERVKEFFNVIDTGTFDFKIGFDSCTVPGLINMTKNINDESFDTCEGGRWSMYITSDMKALPCSFDNQELRWAYDISNDTIENAWNSKQFEDFRNHFRYSCKGCSRQCDCRGGCPIRRQIVLCNREEKELYESAKRFCDQQ